MKIHCGCGKRNFGPGWIHIDGEPFPHVQNHDVFLWDCETESASVIYASHLLEYWDIKEARIILTQWHRVLRPGGILRLAVPDFEAMARLYVSDPKKYPLGALLGPLYGRMLLKNEYIYHKTCYDFESLKALLIEIGFNNVERYDWRQTEHAHIDDHSQAYLPHMSKEKGNLISLNVEAIK